MREAEQSMQICERRFDGLRSNAYRFRFRYRIRYQTLLLLHFFGKCNYHCFRVPADRNRLHAHGKCVGWHAMPWHPNNGTLDDPVDISCEYGCIDYHFHAEVRKGNRCD